MLSYLDSLSPARMSRSASFFASSFETASPFASTSQPISLAALLKQQNGSASTCGLADLSARLDCAVEALSKCSTSCSAECNFEEPSSYYSSDECDDSEEDEDEESDLDSESDDEEFETLSTSTTPSSLSSSIHTSPLLPLKPALRQTTSNGSHRTTSSGSSGEESVKRKASFTEEPPRVFRTYSREEYARLACFVVHFWAVS